MDAELIFLDIKILPNCCQQIAEGNLSPWGLKLATSVCEVKAISLTQQQTTINMMLCEDDHIIFNWSPKGRRIEFLGVEFSMSTCLVVSTW